MGMDFTVTGNGMESRNQGLKKGSGKLHITTGMRKLMQVHVL